MSNRFGKKYLDEYKRKLPLKTIGYIIETF